MQSIVLKKALEQFLTNTSKEGSADNFQFTVPPDHKFGDICINVFPAVKTTKTPPPVLAQEVLEYMKSQTYVTEGNVQGGFVNLFVTDELYQQELAEWKLPTWEKNNEKIIIDYMGANIGKPLHIGHLCTPLFGQATINLLRKMGYDVTADMHQGDWGGIFGKLITGWKYFGDEAAFEKDPVHHLLDIYVKITEKIEKESTNLPPEKVTRLGGESIARTRGGGEVQEGSTGGLATSNTEQECRDAFKKLSEGDEASVKLWQQFTDKSLAGVRAIMSEFGVHPDIWVGESFYEGLPLPKLGNWPDLSPDNTMSAVVDELVLKGIATKNEDGSVGVVFAKETKLPSCILQKRDGTHGYLASDLAAIKYRLKNWSPSRIIYFVDNRQALHFRQLFVTANMAWIEESRETLKNEQNEEKSFSRKEFTDDANDGRAKLNGRSNEKFFGVSLTHAANGFASLPDGAMSTRHGRVIFLRDLITESFDRVVNILAAREKVLSDEDTKSVALGAIIYSFMSQDRERDWVFEWDKVLAFEGNSGPYLQYTYVRWNKILKEIGMSRQAVVNSKQDPVNSQFTVHSVLTTYDRDLVKDILGFNDILEAAGTTHKFHLIVGHLATMARHLNALYVNTPKLKETDESERTTRVQIIKTCLDIISYTSGILGIPLPEEM